MKFVISSAALSSRLLTLGRIIAQRNSMPILGCFCFDIKGTGLTVTASDSDSTLRTTLELTEADQDIRFAVNAKTIQDAIKEVPDQPIDIYVNNDTYEMTIVYLNGQFKLMGQSADEYPEPAADTEGTAHVDIDATHLLTGITRGLMAAATDGARPQLNAVCFDLKADALSMVGTNGNQLALTTLRTVQASAEGVFLLPIRPATVLKGILGKDTGRVSATFGQRNATFVTDTYTFTCRQTDGRYPNYASVIPANNPIAFTVNRTGLVSVLRRVLICANPQAVLVKMRLESNSIVISSQDMDFGMSAEETILCDYAGAPMRIAFRGDSLMNMIANLDSDDITFRISDPSRAAVVVPAEAKDDETALMLIMPSVFTD